MANVIVATFTNMPGIILDNFRQGFVDALVREGNDVLLFKTNQFFKDYNASNTLARNIDEQELIAAINNFKPDLLVSMNHSGLFAGLADSLDCPIGVWLLDGPSYLLEPEECKKQASRYQMFSPVRAFRGDLKESFGVLDKNIHELPFASDFQASTDEQTQNISFIGTNFTGWRLQEIIQNSGSARNLIKKIRALVESYGNDRDTVFATRLKKYELEHVFTGEFDEAYILNTLSINYRIKVLDAVADMELALYGTTDWPEVMKYSVNLAMSFDPRQVSTKRDLQQIYNSSKINLNISHFQARGGVPWRIFDAMSCNGVLVSDPQADLDRLFGPDLKIPIYESPAEARDLCRQLLMDEPRRLELARVCQLAIESGHRIKHRIKTMSEVLNINLLPGGEGKFTELQVTDFQNALTSQISFNTLFENGLNDKSPKQFSLQVFQSDLLNFAPEDSLLAYIDIPESSQIAQEFQFANSKPFIRFDFGEYFSLHVNAKLSVSEDTGSQRNGERVKEIDLAKDIIQSNEFLWSDSELCCGFDSYCVFVNPFPGKDIRIRFKSLVKARI